MKARNPITGRFYKVDVEVEKPAVHVVNHQSSTPLSDQEKADLFVSHGGDESEDALLYADQGSVVWEVTRSALIIFFFFAFCVAIVWLIGGARW